MKKFFAFIICLVCMFDISFAAAPSPVTTELTARKIENKAIIKKTEPEAEEIIEVEKLPVSMSEVKIIEGDKVIEYSSDDPELMFRIVNENNEDVAAIDTVFDEESSVWHIIILETYTDFDTAYLMVYKLVEIEG